MIKTVEVLHLEINPSFLHMVNNCVLLLTAYAFINSRYVAYICLPTVQQFSNQRIECKL